MPYFDTSSRQLEFIDRFYGAYRTRNVEHIRPFLAEDYIYKAFPETPELPEMTKEKHLEIHGGMFAACVKYDVSIQAVPKRRPRAYVRYRLACHP